MIYFQMIPWNPQKADNHTICIDYLAHHLSYKDNSAPRWSQFSKRAEHPKNPISHSQVWHWLRNMWDMHCCCSISSLTKNNGTNVIKISYQVNAYFGLLPWTYNWCISIIHSSSSAILTCICHFLNHIPNLTFEKIIILKIWYFFI